MMQAQPGKKKRSEVNVRVKASIELPFVCVDFRDAGGGPYHLKSFLFFSLSASVSVSLSD